MFKIRNIRAARNSISLIALFFLCITTYAAGEIRVSGAQQIGMGLNSISMINAYSVYNNQAAGAYLERPSFGIYYAPVFLGQNVNNISAVVAVPVKKGGTIGLSVNYFGYSLFNEKKVGLSYSIKVAKWMSLGMQLDYLNTQISGYGSKNYATFELGVFTKPIDELAIAFHVYNPLKLYIDKATGDKIPTLFRLGITYEALKKFFISVQLDKDLTNKLVFRAGAEYTLKDLINFRAGVASDPVTGTVGVGVLLKQGISFDVAFSYQGTLGFQPHFGITYTMKKKNILKNLTSSTETTTTTTTNSKRKRKNTDK